MRTISKSRKHFHGTHRGYEIEIDREHPPVESFGERHFYIRVFNDYGHAYDGYSPAGVTTLAEAKREALYGACLKKRPPAESGADVNSGNGTELHREASSEPESQASPPIGAEGGRPTSAGVSGCGEGTQEPSPSGAQSDDGRGAS